MGGRACSPPSCFVCRIVGGGGDDTRRSSNGEQRTHCCWDQRRSCFCVIQLVRALAVKPARCVLAKPVARGNDDFHPTESFPAGTHSVNPTLSRPVHLSRRPQRAIRSARGRSLLHRTLHAHVVAVLLWLHVGLTMIVLSGKCIFSSHDCTTARGTSFHLYT